MKNTKFLLIIVGLLLIQLSALNAQGTMVVESEAILSKLRLNKGIEGNVSVSYSSIDGDPYIFKDFQKGRLVLNSGETAEVDMRYDISANEMHMKYNNQIYAIFHPEKVKLIEAGNLKFIYSKYLKSEKDETPKEGSYFIVKTDGKCKLLIKKNIRIQDAELPKPLQDAKPAKFIPTNDTYYLKLDNESAVRVRNKNEVLAVMEDKKAEIEKYISSNKSDIKNIKDLDKIITFYNGL
ncbi:MAG: hypothetical protein LLG13_12970 [Bacteroidales bacterium]|nr:hypothetical protein [Bacteroidales bacterium]